MLRRLRPDPRRGFTLVELVCVMLVLAVVATIAFASFTTTSDRTQSQTTQITLKSFMSESLTLVKQNDADGFAAEHIRNSADGIDGWTVNTTPGAHSTGDKNLAATVSPKGSRMGLATASANKCFLGLATDGQKRDTWERLDLPGAACTPQISFLGAAYTGPLVVADVPVDPYGYSSAATVTVGWTNPETGAGMTGTRIYRDGIAIAEVPLGTMEYHDSAVTLHATYSYAFASYNNAGESALSPAVSVLVINGPPGAPSNLTATAGDAQVVLSWPSTPGVAVYRIFRDNVEIGTVNTPTLTYTSTGLTNGQTYSFYIVGNNAAGDGPPSITRNATPQPPPPAAPPTVTANGGYRQVTVSWSAPSGVVDGYRVYRNTALVATVAGNVLSHTSTGLADGTSYNFTIRAFNGGGSSPDSPIATGTTAPVAPTSLTAAPFDQLNDLSWVAASGVVTGYRVYRDGALVGSSSTTSYRDAGLVNGQTYSYVVRAYNSGGNSPDSNTATGTPYTPTLPGAPASASVVDTGTGARVSFTAPTSSGSEPITGYRVTAVNGTTTHTLNVTASPAEFGTVANTGTRWTFTVYAQTRAGEGPGTSAYVPAPTTSGSVRTAFVQTGTGYYCDSGHTLSGTTCTHTYAAYWSPGYYECHNGGTLSGSTCVNGYSASIVYYCDSGHTLSGSTCYYPATGTTTYYCDSGWTLSSTQCYQAAEFHWAPCPSGYAAVYYVGECWYGSGYASSDQVCHDRSPGQYVWDSSKNCWEGDQMVLRDYYYHCHNGGSLSGDKCWKAANTSTTYSCPKGTLSGTTCYYPANYYYTCPYGGTLSGDWCDTSYAAHWHDGYYYCNSGDSLSGSTCYHSHPANSYPIGYYDYIVHSISASYWRALNLNGSAISPGQERNMGRCPNALTLNVSGLGGSASTGLGSYCN